MSPLSMHKIIIICRMIESFNEGSSEVKNMIHIQFQQSATQDKTSTLNCVGCFVFFHCCCLFQVAKANLTYHPADN